MNSGFFKILSLIFIVLALTSCAKRGRPTGGEKDEIPPILISASPDQETIHFDATKIKIYFDEYVKLKDVNRKLIISPPFKNAPDITPVGTASKIITIKLRDSLKENTTYTFNFGNSVVDNNEGNMLERFKYVFSTGSYIDSLKISGDISDALDRKTASNILVMLYEIDSTFNDSIIYKEKPTYVSSTQDSTNFELTNLKEGQYLVLAVKQPNNNYIYNPKQDKIGFLKEPITLPTDTTFNISIFKEVLPFKIVRAIQTTKGHIIFSYQGNSKQLIVKLLDSISGDYKTELAFEEGKDTLNYWYRNISKDSLQFEITNTNYKDTMTVKLKSSKQDTLIVRSDFKSLLNPRDTFSIRTNIPISKINSSEITVFDMDTVAVPFSTQINYYKKNLYINFKQEYKNKYTIQLLPNAIFDVFGNTNDTLTYRLKTKKIEDFGILKLNVTNVNSPVIIQITNEKDELVASKKINTSQIITFKNLPPKKYIARAIFDDNNNGVWDTGNYLLKRHPEKVIYINAIIELRANWERNVDFSLK